MATAPFRRLHVEGRERALLLEGGAHHWHDTVGGRPGVIVPRPRIPTFAVEGGPVFHQPQGHLLVPAFHQPSAPVEQALEQFTPETVDARLEHQFGVPSHDVERIVLHAAHAAQVRERAGFAVEGARREKPLVREEEPTRLAHRHREVWCRRILLAPRATAGHHATVGKGCHAVNRDALVSVRWLVGAGGGTLSRA